MEMTVDLGDLEGFEPARLPRSDKVAEKVAKEILQDIVNRGLAADTKLPPEAEMLKRYRVGRASLREALRILEVYGLLWIKPGPGGGPVVAEMNSLAVGRSASVFFHAMGATLKELVEARVHLEPLYARLAAENLTDQTAAQLRSVLSREEALLADGPLPNSRTDLFHTVVAGMTENKVVGLMGQGIIHIYVARVRPVFKAEQRSGIHDVHEKIAAAILAKDAARAERLMRKHVEAIATQFKEHFASSLEEVIDWR